MFGRILAIRGWYVLGQPVATLAFVFMAIFFPQLAQGAEEVTCKCEPAQCKPCEVAVGQRTFYTAKCGPNNSKIKSCARVTCEPVPDRKQCLAERNGEGGDKQALAKTGSATSPRGVAAVSEPVGAVANVAGQAQLIRVGGSEGPARLRARVFEGDVVETAADGKVRIEFNDGNVLNVSPGSRVTIETQRNDPRAGRRKTLLNLMYGKIRTKVNKAGNYDGANNSFQVRTKTAVAGVRGTDFVTVFTPGDKNWITEVKTFEGHVEFGGDSRPASVDVRAGEAASFIISAPPPGELSNAQLRSFIEKGILSEIRKMQADELEKVNTSTDFGPMGNDDTAALAPGQGREPAAAPFEAVCDEPQADHKWCSFTCEKNPPGQAKCNTRLPGVRCVRRICNASGRWAEPTALPKGAWSACDATGVAVRSDCGDY